MLTLQPTTRWTCIWFLLLRQFCVSFFRKCEVAGLDSTLVAKTYDLKSVYRQVPISSEMTICVFPTSAFTTVSVNVLRCTSWLHFFFGATHSVYSFLRLSRSLYIFAARALYLLTTNFYDDYILASRPGSMDLARNSMDFFFF